MESLYFLIPLSILVVTAGIWLFFWAVNNGQYDDLDGEAERILFDESNVDGRAEKSVKGMPGLQVKSQPSSTRRLDSAPGHNGGNSEND